MKLTSVTIEGMHNVVNATYNFADTTYFYGPNGAGKSTILEAIQLALLGYIPGHNKTNEAIFGHSNNHTMAVTVKLDDDGQLVTITRIWTKNTKSINSSVVVYPETYDVKTIVGELELPIFNFSEFTNLSANKQKDWFIGMLPKESQDIDWYAEFSSTVPSAQYLSDYEYFIHDCINSFQSNSVGVDNVRDMNLHLKAMLSVHKAEVQRISKSILSLVLYDQAPPAYDLPNLEAESAELWDKLQKYNAQQDTMKQCSQLESQLAMLKLDATSVEDDPKYIDIIHRISLLKEDQTAIQSHIDTINQRLQQIQFEMNSRLPIKQSLGLCPYTHDNCDSIAKLVEQYENEYEQYRSEYTQSVAELHNVKQDYTRTIQEIAELRTLKSQIESNYIRGNQIKQKLDQLSEQPTIEVDPQTVYARIQELTNQISQVKANQQYNQLIQKWTKEQYQLEQEINLLNTWIKHTDANSLQMRLMVAPFHGMETKITPYLQDLMGNSQVSAKFDLRSKANSFSFGVQVGSTYIPFSMLSSGEKCLFMLALMTIMVLQFESPLKLIIIDDLLDHLDEKAFTALFNNISDMSKDLDIQYIFAGVSTTEANNQNLLVQHVNSRR